MTTTPTKNLQLKEQLLALRDRENRFDTVQKCRKQQLNSPLISEVTSEHKDLATQWMQEVVIDSRVRLEVFLHAVSILDSFLELCFIQTNQVQLCASACLMLASKVRNDIFKDTQIIEYTDDSITPSELKAWEMLILSKLDWDVNLVIALDYLEPLQSLWPKAKTDSNELKECSVLCCRASQSATFRARFPPKIVALSAWNKAISEDILAHLQVSKELLDECSKAMHFKGTPNTPSVSPFKVESSSTPKSTRVPLRDNIEVTNIRRRLTSLNTSLGEDKENNDSAIGLLNTTHSSPTGSGLGSGSGSGSKSSSVQSSPDSGAACKSPDIADLDQQLQSTKLSP